MERLTPDAWFLASPARVLGCLAWLLGWLALEARWYRRTRTPWSGRHVALSLQTTAIVGTAQVALSLALAPLLWLAWPRRLWTLSMDSWWHWALAWTVVDFAYYWIHRALHATRLGWALHAPHHSSLQVTMLDSLRMSWGEQPVGVLVYGIPLVLLGVPPYVAALFYGFVSLYQFIVHTEMGWSLGALDGIVYTPAAHRSHHSCERTEADANYGGFFVVFDRLFGTFTPTRPNDRPAVYGLPDRRASDLADVAFGELRRVAAALRSTPGLVAKLRFALTRP